MLLLVFSVGLGPLSSSGPQPAAQAAAGLPAPSPALSAAPAAPVPTVYVGGRIAFESGRTGGVPGGNPAEIYVMEADGSDQINLTQNPATDRFPAWSPDGTKIAFTSDRDGNFEVYVMNADGSGQRRLTNSSQPEYTPAWSPDGSKIAFTRLVQIQVGNATYSSKRVHVMNADGSGETELLPSSTMEGFSQVQDLAWSPDGMKVAFRFDGYTNVPDCEGRHSTILVVPWPVPSRWSCVAAGMRVTPYPGGYGGGENFWPAWSPDGKKLAYIGIYAGVEKDGSYLEVVDTTTADPSTGKFVNRTLLHSVFVPHVLQREPSMVRPAWSPDGSHIAFTLWDSAMEAYQTYVIKADGTGLYNLGYSGATDVHPSWTPYSYVRPAVHGKRVAYQTGGLGETAAIIVQDPVTKASEVIALGGLLRLGGLWEDKVVYQKQNAAGRFDVYLYDLTAGTPTQLSPDDGQNHRHPYVWNNRVVWYHAGSPPGYYLYDIATRQLRGLNIVDAPDRSTQYLMNEDRLAFMDQFVPKVYDLNTGQITALAAADKSHLGAVSANAVVQVMLGPYGDNDLYVTRPITGTRRRISTLVESNQVRPALSGDLLAWQDDRGGAWNIYALDLAQTSPERFVTQGGGAVAPAVHRGCVAWLSAATGAWAPEQYKCLAPYEIQGKVKDVVMEWPGVKIDENRPLRDIPVTAQSPGKKAVNPTTTASDGTYRLLPAEPGEYKVQVTWPVPPRWELAQAAQLAISDTARSASQDFHLPVSLVTSAEQTLAQMRDLPPPKISDFDVLWDLWLGGRPPWKKYAYQEASGLFSYYLEGIKGRLNEEWYPGVYRGPGQTSDPATNLERQLMAFQFALKRFPEAATSADDVVKPLEIYGLTSLFGWGPFKSKVLERLEKLKSEKVNNWAKSLLQGKDKAKGGVIQAGFFSLWYGMFVTQLDMPPEEKQLRMSIIPKIHRFLNALIRNRFEGDFAFELAFQGIREALSSELLRLWYLPRSEASLNKAHGQASGDTNDALNNTSILDDWATACSQWAHQYTLWALFDINAVRGAKGVWEASEWMDKEGQLQRLNFGRLSPLLKAFSQISKVASPILFTVAIASGLGNLDRLQRVDVPMAVDLAFSPPKGRLEGDFKKHCPQFGLFQNLPASVTSLASVAGPVAASQGATYNQRLDAVLAALERRDQVALEAALDPLLEANSALDAALEQSFLRLSAAYPQAVNTVPGFHAVYSDTVKSYMSSLNGREYVHGQLAAWLESDLEEARTEVLSEGPGVKDANTQAEAALARATAALGSTPIPAAIALDVQVPERGVVGQRAIVTATVANQGDQAAQGVELVLVPHESISPLSPITQTVGTLAPGGHTRVTWQIQPTVAAPGRGAVVEVEAYNQGWVARNVYDMFPVTLGSSSQMRVEVASPVTLLVRDTEGRRVGFDPASGQAVNEIPGSAYSGREASPQWVTLADPFGAYTARVTGSAHGTYRLEARASLDGQVISERTVRGTITSTQTAEVYLPVDFREAQPIIGRSCLGDFDGDSQVDVLDIQRVAGRWLAAAGAASYERRYDLDRSGEIDLLDIMSVAGRWGQACPVPAAPQSAAAARDAWRAASGAGPALRLRPEAPTVAAGSTFTVAVGLDQVAGLGAFQFRLGYDPAVLRLEEVRTGRLMATGGRTWQALGPRQEPGSVDFGAFSYGPAGPGSAGELAVLRFTALGPGSSPLQLEQALVADLLGQEITVGATSGQVQVGGGLRVYLPSVMKSSGGW